MEVDGFHSGIASKFGVFWFLIPCRLLELFSLCERLSWIVRALRFSWPQVFIGCVL
jgi:hypothetical protein